MTTLTVPNLLYAPVETHSTKGDRAYQQDACDWVRATDPDGGLPAIVAAVADGCGSGAGSGRITKAAARTAVRIAAAYGPDHLDHAIDATRELVDHQHPRRGWNDNTTLVAAYYNVAALHVAWIGDSRAYALTADGELRRLTEDHNLAKFGAPNRLTRALLGDTEHRHEAPAADCSMHAPQLAARLLGPPFSQITRVLLCTDGVCGPLTDEDIRSTLTTVSDASTAARQLTSRAVRADRAVGEEADNATALVIDLAGPVS